VAVIGAGPAGLAAGYFPRRFMPAALVFRPAFLKGDFFQLADI
jgi:thioredoxin reductase